MPPVVAMTPSLKQKAKALLTNLISALALNSAVGSCAVISN